MICGRIVKTLSLASDLERSFTSDTLTKAVVVLVLGNSQSNTPSFGVDEVITFHTLPPSIEYSICTDAEG